MDKGPGHLLLVHVFEVFEHLQQVRIVVGAVVADLCQNLPGLQHLVGFVQIVQAHTVSLKRE